MRHNPKISNPQISETTELWGYEDMQDMHDICSSKLSAPRCIYLQLCFGG